MLDDARHYVEPTVMVRSQHTNEPTEAAASPATRLRFDAEWTAVRRLQPVSAEGGVVVYEVPLSDAAGPEIMSGPLFWFLKIAAARIQALVVAVGS